jgi:hypothetical protein
LARTYFAPSRPLGRLAAGGSPPRQHTHAFVRHQLDWVLSLRTVHGSYVMLPLLFRRASRGLVCSSACMRRQLPLAWCDFYQLIWQIVCLVGPCALCPVHVCLAQHLIQTTFIGSHLIVENLAVRCSTPANTAKTDILCTHLVVSTGSCAQSCLSTSRTYVQAVADSRMPTPTLLHSYLIQQWSRPAHHQSITCGSLSAWAACDRPLSLQPQQPQRSPAAPQQRPAAASCCRGAACSAAGGGVCERRRGDGIRQVVSGCLHLQGGGQAFATTAVIRIRFSWNVSQASIAHVQLCILNGVPVCSPHRSHEADG